MIQLKCNYRCFQLKTTCKNKYITSSSKDFLGDNIPLLQECRLLEISTVM